MKSINRKKVDKKIVDQSADKTKEKKLKLGQKLEKRESKSAGGAAG